ncbi:hypothetical protein HDF11_002075 [Tunturiibacter psychrotolerans]
MPIGILVAAILSFISACAVAQTDTGPVADVRAIQRLINQDAQAIDTIDLKLLSQIWSHSSEVSFIYPLGEEHGFDAVKEHCSKMSWVACFWLAISKQMVFQSTSTVMRRGLNSTESFARQCGKTNQA